jgi:hypothetical protein
MDAGADKVTANGSRRDLQDVGDVTFGSVFPVDEEHDSSLAHTERSDGVAHLHEAVRSVDVPMRYCVEVSPPLPLPTAAHVARPIGNRPVQERGRMLHPPFQEVRGDIKEHCRRNVMGIVRSNQCPSETNKQLAVI